MKSLTEELLVWHDDRQKSVVEQNIASGQSSIIVMNNQDIGWMHVQEDPVAIELGQLYIVPDLQNCGIGTTIVRRLQSRAKVKDKALTLNVMRNNKARHLYERLGFVQTGESPFKLEMVWHG